MDNRPIGVFDSGLGGLTVLSELISAMPNENYIYFGDNARVPYGSKSKETIIEYSRQIVSFLIRQNVKAIVIACGTASSLAYESIKKEFDVPIIDVISPTAKNLKTQSCGIIATTASIKSKVWQSQIKKYNHEAKTTSKACPLFVPVVEEGLVETKIADDVIELYLSPLKNKKIDSLVLGCTHYPLLYKKIKAYMPANTKVVNINKYCSKELKSLLTKNKMSNDRKKKPQLIAYTTDDVINFIDNSEKFCNITFDKVMKAKL